MYANFWLVLYVCSCALYVTVAVQIGNHYIPSCVSIACLLSHAVNACRPVWYLVGLCFDPNDSFFVQIGRSIIRTCMLQMFNIHLLLPFLSNCIFLTKCHMLFLCFYALYTAIIFCDLTRITHVRHKLAKLATPLLFGDEGQWASAALPPGWHQDCLR